jgi:hypothetical protein
MCSRGSRLLTLFVILGVAVMLAGCGDRSAGQVDITTIVDNTPVTPDQPIILQLNTKGQVKLYDRWFDLYSDAAQIDEFLHRKSVQYRQMLRDYGLTMEKKMVRGECILVLPVDVIIEPEFRTKVGYISRLTRLCTDNGFQKVQIRREGEDTAVRVAG